MRKWIGWSAMAAGILTLLAAAAMEVPAVQDWLFAAVLREQLKVGDADQFPADTLRVVFCGTAAPPPSPGRAKACTLVIAGGRAFVVDVGPKSADNLGAWRFPMERISAILLTHFHSDHIGELGEFATLAWAAGRKGPLPVYGPEGVGEVVAGFDRAYALDRGYRFAHHGTALDPAGRLVARDFGLADLSTRARHDAARVIYDRDHLRITAFQVVHEPVWPAVGYRFDYRGRSVVISGDTAWSDNLLARARDADLLVIEGQADALRLPLIDAAERAQHSQIVRLMRDVERYHIKPPEAARLADRAGVAHLAFTHLGPLAPRNGLMRALFGRDVHRQRGDGRIADDGLIADLPVGSTTVRFRRTD